MNIYDKVSVTTNTLVPNMLFSKPRIIFFEYTQSDVKLGWESESEVRNAIFLLQMGQISSFRQVFFSNCRQFRKILNVVPGHSNYDSCEALFVRISECFEPSFYVVWKLKYDQLKFGVFSRKLVHNSLFSLKTRFSGKNWMLKKNKSEKIGPKSKK